MDDVNEVPRELREALDALEVRAARAASTVDVERVAARVLERLRTEPVDEVPVRRWTWTARRAAAAALMLVGGGLVARRMTMAPPVVASRALPVPAAESLSTQQAEAALEAAGQVHSSDTTAIGSTTVLVDDLTEAELRALLRAMQSTTEGT